MGAVIHGEHCTGCFARPHKAAAYALLTRSDRPWTCCGRAGLAGGSGVHLHADGRCRRRMAARLRRCSCSFIHSPPRSCLAVVAALAPARAAACRRLRTCTRALWSCSRRPRVPLPPPAAACAHEAPISLPAGVNPSGIGKVRRLRMTLRRQSHFRTRIYACDAALKARFLHFLAPTWLSLL